MPTVTAIRDAIKTRIETVNATPDAGANTGNVYTKQVFSITEGFVRKHMTYTATADDSIRGWQIMHRGTQPTKLAVGLDDIVHTWEVEGFYEADVDEPLTSNGEALFDELCNAILIAFTSDADLGITGLTVEVDEQSGMALSRDAVENLAGVLVHRATMTLQTRHTE